MPGVSSETGVAGKVRLKEIVATYLYLKENNIVVINDFLRADSNVRGSYHRQAHELIVRLVSSYFRLAPFGKLISGCIRDTLHHHGQINDVSTIQSLTKRIVSRIPEYLRQGKCGMSSKTRKAKGVMRLE